MGYKDCWQPDRNERTLVVTPQQRQQQEQQQQGVRQGKGGKPGREAKDGVA